MLLGRSYIPVFNPPPNHPIISQILQCNCELSVLRSSLSCYFNPSWKYCISAGSNLIRWISLYKESAGHIPRLLSSDSPHLLQFVSFPYETVHNKTRVYWGYAHSILRAQMAFTRHALSTQWLPTESTNKTNHLVLTSYIQGGLNTVSYLLLHPTRKWRYFQTQDWLASQNEHYPLSRLWFLIWHILSWADSNPCC